MVPALSSGFVGQGVLPTLRPAHTRRGYRCYIYGMQTRGADRAGADVEYRGVGGVSCVEVRVTNGGGVAWGHPVRSGDAQHLNGQGPSRMCIRPIRGRKGVGCTCNTQDRTDHSKGMRVSMAK